MAASIVSTVSCVFFLVLPVFHAANGPTLDDLLHSIEELVDYYRISYKTVNLDGIFGLRVVEGQLISLLEDYDRGKFPHLDINTVTRLRKIQSDATQISDEAVPFLKEEDPDYFQKLRPLIENPWRMFKKHKWIKPSLKWGKGITSKKPANFDEEFSDKCMSQLMGLHKGQQTEKCDISEDCFRGMTSRGLTEYGITHQLLYTLLADKNDCLDKLNGWLREHTSFSNVQEVQLDFCTNNYYEVQQLVKLSGEQIVPRYQDLFLEQEFVCPSLGFIEFLRLDWLEQILRWQKPSGCFGKMKKSAVARNSRFNKKDYEYDQHTNHKEKNKQVRLKFKQRTNVGDNVHRYQEDHMNQHANNMNFDMHQQFENRGRILQMDSKVVPQVRSVQMQQQEPREPVRDAQLPADNKVAPGVILQDQGDKHVPAPQPATQMQKRAEARIPGPQRQDVNLNSVKHTGGRSHYGQDSNMVQNIQQKVPRVSQNHHARTGSSVKGKTKVRLNMASHAGQKIPRGTGSVILNNQQYQLANNLLVRNDGKPSGTRQRVKQTLQSSQNQILQQTRNFVSKKIPQQASNLAKNFHNPNMLPQTQMLNQGRLAAVRPDGQLPRQGKISESIGSNSPKFVQNVIAPKVSLGGPDMQSNQKWQIGQSQNLPQNQPQIQNFKAVQNGGGRPQRSVMQTDSNIQGQVYTRQHDASKTFLPRKARYKARRLLVEKELDGGCFSHKTAVAGGALSQYLRFMIDPGPPEFQGIGLTDASAVKDSGTNQRHRTRRGNVNHSPLRPRIRMNIPKHSKVVKHDEYDKPGVDTRHERRTELDEQPALKVGHQGYSQNTENKRDEEYEQYIDNNEDDRPDVKHRPIQRPKFLPVPHGRKDTVMHIQHETNDDQDGYNYYDNHDDETKPVNIKQDLERDAKLNRRDHVRLFGGNRRDFYKNVSERVMLEYTKRDSIERTYIFIFFGTASMLLMLMYRFIKQRRVSIRYYLRYR